MVQQFFNGMLTLMLAKFILNDVPHAAGMSPAAHKDKRWLSGGAFTLGKLFSDKKATIDNEYELYHITKSQNLTAILAFGLKPPKAKSGLFLGGVREKPAVYLVTDVGFLDGMLGDFIDFGLEGGSIQEEDELAVLRVILPADWRVEVDMETPPTEDLPFPMAVMSYQKIPPGWIALYAKETV